MKSVIMAAVLALLTTGCASVQSVGEMILVMDHVNDTPQEHLDHLDRQLARLHKWCHQDEQSACDKAKILEKEKAGLLASERK